MVFKTTQEEFWAGTFGSEYIPRNSGADLLAANLAFFSQALRCAHQLRDCLELGANIGMNLRALRLLYPNQQQYAVEINNDAADQLTAVIPESNITRGSILEYEPEKTFDLVLIKGVLIHINPEFLPAVYDRLRRAMGRYLLLCEYYNPSPVAVSYRGHTDRLYKRDFCGEMLDLYDELRLIDYGFCYRRDPDFPQDDITWFLMEKRG